MSTAVLTEADVNARHRERVDAALAEHNGNKFAVASSTWAEIQEAMRQDWLTFYGQGDEPRDPSQPRRGDKSKAVAQFFADNIGKTINPQAVADEVGCTVPLVHQYIRDHRSGFRSAGRGLWVVLDEAADREAARIEKRSAPVAAPAPVVSHDAAAAEAALRAFTGHGDRSGKP